MVNKELLFTVLFTILAVVYWVLALRGKEKVNYAWSIVFTLWAIICFSNAGYLKMSRSIVNSLYIVQIIIAVWGVWIFYKDRKRNKKNN